MDNNSPKLVIKKEKKGKITLFDSSNPLNDEAIKEAIEEAKTGKGVNVIEVNGNPRLHLHLEVKNGGIKIRFRKKENSLDSLDK